jgi:hypothetical protein
MIEKLISAVSGVTCTGVFVWIAYSFIEIGVFGLPHDWNFLIVLMEVF